MLCSLVDVSRHLEKNMLPSSSTLFTLIFLKIRCVSFSIQCVISSTNTSKETFLEVTNSDSNSINWNIKESLFNETITFMLLHKEKSVIKKHYCLHVICSTTNLLNYALFTNILNPLDVYLFLHPKFSRCLFHTLHHFTLIQHVPIISPPEEHFPTRFLLRRIYVECYQSKACGMMG